MKNIALASPSQMSAAERAAEITAILATAVVRNALAAGAREAEIGVGFLPEQSVHTTPYREERL